MTRAYFNQRAAIWDGTVAEKDVNRLEQTAEHLNIKPGSTVLDVGSGTGVFIPCLLSKIGESGRLVALDCAEEMLKYARARGFKGNIAYLHADVTGLPLQPETFDVVVCYSSFPHFQDKPVALAEMGRVVKPGGELYICHTLSRARINEIHRASMAVQNDIMPDEAEMQTLLSTAGFTDIKIEDSSQSYLASGRKPKQVAFLSSDK